MDLIQINNGLEEVYRDSYTVYQEAAIAESAYKKAKDQKDIRLAVIMNREEGSDAARKRRAIATPEYKKFINDMTAVAERHFLASSQKQALETRLSCLQTLAKNYISDNSYKN